MSQDPQELRDGDAVEGTQEDGVSEDGVPEDDAIIGHVFRRSLWVIAAIGGIALLVLWMVNRPESSAPEQEIVSEAPEQVAQAAEEVPVVEFTEISAAAGVDFTHYNGARGDKLLPETMGGGVAFFDFDNDLDADLLLVNSSDWPHTTEGRTKATLTLFRNDGTGSFSDVTREMGLDHSLYGMGVAVADYDGDGAPDLMVTAVGENRLFRQENGVYQDVTDRAGVAGDSSDWSTGAAFFDYDGDGDLDLFVANYVRWSKEIDFELDYRLTGVGRAYGPVQNYEGTFPYLYRNNGDGTFTDVSAESGVRVENPATGLPAGKALGLGVVDVDKDGHMDLFVANDTVGNFFFHNQGDGTFEEAGELFGVAYDRNGNATGAMGVDMAHYRNDQNLGFMIGNFANEMTSVYVTQDDPRIFVDEAIGEGIGAPSRRMLSFGLFLFDYDLDGRLDLLQTNGHLEEEIGTVDPSQQYRQPAQLFWNGGLAEGFVTVDGESTGDLSRPIVGRGSAYADIDADGDLDVILTEVGGRPLLLRNDQKTGHHWLRLHLQGKAPNTDAIGAWVELQAAGVVQKRQVMPTRSYLAQVERTLTFGLGEATKVDRVEIIWPDGSRQQLEGLAVDQMHTIRQGVNP